MRVSKSRNGFWRLLPLLVVLSAFLFFGASWPGASAQQATPDEAAQIEVTAPDETPPPDETEIQTTDQPIETDGTESEAEPPPPPPTTVPVNSDFLQVNGGPGGSVVEPGAVSEFVFDYQVTTPRVSTTIVAALAGISGENGAWTIQLQAGGVWSDAGSSAQLTDVQYIDAGTAIPLSVVVTAPPTVTVDETITIWLSSSVARFDGGVEQGIVANEPVASVQVASPPATQTPIPTVQPTEVPLLEPTLTCTGPEDGKVTLGAIVQLACEIDIQDNRTVAMLEIVPPSAWTVRTADSQDSQFSDALELGPFAFTGDPVAIQTVSIELQAPSMAGPTGSLALRLVENSDARTEFDRTSISLQTIVPEDWKLSCNAGSTLVTPGASVEIACELPEAAWTLHGADPIFAYSTAAKWASGSKNVIDNAVFSFSLAVPCTAPAGDTRLSVSADLDNGVALDAPVMLSIDPSGVQAAPRLTHTDIDFGDAQWLGTSYAPSETTVTLTVSGASSVCAPASWSIQMSTTSFSNGELSFDPSIEFSTVTSSGEAVSPALDGRVVPDAAATVVSGTGDGEIVVRLTMDLPATVEAGTFTGTVEFLLSTGPYPQ